LQHLQQELYADLFLGRLPKFGSRPNNMGVKMFVRMSVYPQKVSLISMKFGMQVVHDERFTTV